MIPTDLAVIMGEEGITDQNQGQVICMEPTLHKRKNLNPISFKDEQQNRGGLHQEAVLEGGHEDMDLVNKLDLKLKK